MSILSSRARSRTVGHPPDSAIYRQSFLLHVHYILAVGYGRLASSQIPLAGKNETAITGHLVRNMREAMQEPDAPSWMERYAVHDDPPVEFEGREGKRRPRVDIAVEFCQRGVRPRFQFEAKRLRRNDKKCVTKYLGVSGLGCFVSGKYCAGSESAGMLGYLESDSPAYWAGKIKTQLENKPKQYRVHSRPAMMPVSMNPKLDSYQSRHGRPRLSLITIYHSLLLIA